jgi:hypothetical protein
VPFEHAAQPFRKTNVFTFGLFLTQAILIRVRSPWERVNFSRFVGSSSS